MKVLAFDTSSKALSVALLEEENRLAELTLTIKKKPQHYLDADH